MCIFSRVYCIYLENATLSFYYGFLSLNVCLPRYITWYKRLNSGETVDMMFGR